MDGIGLVGQIQVIQVLRHDVSVAALAAVHQQEQSEAKRECAQEVPHVVVVVEEAGLAQLARVPRTQSLRGGARLSTEEQRHRARKRTLFEGEALKKYMAGNAVPSKHARMTRRVMRVGQSTWCSVPTRHG